LSAAWLGRLLTNWAPQAAIRSLDIRFAAITHVGERITCTGKVAGKFEHEGRRCVKLQLATANQDGMTKLTGEAVVAWR
jgi:acyl dehydratase